ncbi:MAG: hypothetical protein AAGA27_03245 [Pseudomonadota bacterium]
MNKKDKLDAAEEDVLKSVEAGEWQSVKDLDKEKTKAIELARSTLRKSERINIRMPRADLDRIKQIAAYKGLPYQTLVASVLHKYAAGHFK